MREVLCYLDSPRARPEDQDRHEDEPNLAFLSLPHTAIKIERQDCDFSLTETTSNIYNMDFHEVSVGLRSKELCVHQPKGCVWLQD